MGPDFSKAAVIGKREVRTAPTGKLRGEPSKEDSGWGLPSFQVVSPQMERQESYVFQPSWMTIEEAMASYLQEQKANGRSHKTMEWHQTALGLLQAYLVDERQLTYLCQLAESEMRGWLAFLSTAPSTVETGRSVATIATYARSAKAFCHWLVRKGYVEQMPFVKGMIPKAEKKPIGLIGPETFERLLLACRPDGERGMAMERAAARNRALLWVFLDTGMRVSEVCGLRLWDVDREQRALRVQRRGDNACWLRLSANGWYQLLSYLERYRPTGVLAKEEENEENHLFLSEWYRPLIPNGITLLFGRLRKRTGINEKYMNPSMLRDTFAVRYLQQGGEPEGLRDLLGLENMTAIKRYQRLSEQEQPRAHGEERPVRQTT